MTALQIREGHIQGAAKKCNSYIDRSSTLANKHAVRCSKADPKPRVKTKVDCPVSTLSAYKADVSSYLAAAYGLSSRED